MPTMYKGSGLLRKPKPTSRPDLSKSCTSEAGRTARMHCHFRRKKREVLSILCRLCPTVCPLQATNAATALHCFVKPRTYHGLWWREKLVSPSKDFILNIMRSWARFALCWLLSPADLLARLLLSINLRTEAGTCRRFYSGSQGNT